MEIREHAEIQRDMWEKLNVEINTRQNSGGEDCGFGFPVVETRGQSAAMRTHTHTLPRILHLLVKCSVVILGGKNSYFRQFNTDDNLTGHTYRFPEKSALDQVTSDLRIMQTGNRVIFTRGLVYNSIPLLVFFSSKDRLLFLCCRR